MPELQISLDKVCWIILKAREFDVKTLPTDEDSGSNPADDKMADVLEEHSDDPVVDELTAFVDAMDDDEQIDLVALMWLGRGDADASEWGSLRDEASRAHNERTARYLLGTPLLGDHLEEGLDKLDLSCEDVDFDRWRTPDREA
ncbi:MAG: DUF3775 domain-containing protein [Pseudomonadota bacterium]